MLKTTSNILGTFLIQISKYDQQRMVKVKNP